MKYKKYLRSLTISLLACNMLACATGNNPIDPYESYNRKMFLINGAVDKVMIRPIALTYKNYTPDPLQNIINNFYNNMRDFVSLGNDVFQLKGMSIMQTTMRISINTVFGLFGFIDVASSLGLKRELNSFGNTFKAYGWKNSSYIVLPLLGSSTIRDGVGLIPDIYFNPTWYLFSDWISYTSFGIQLIHTRSTFIGIDTQIEQMSLDPYITIRDIYMQSRGYIAESQIQDTDIDDLIDSESPVIDSPKRDDIGI